MRIKAVLFAVLTACAAHQAAAQQAQQLTAADYARAEQFLWQNTAPLVYGADVDPEWLDEDTFWYQNDVRGGTEYILVDAGRRARAFEHERMARALSAAADTTFDALELPRAELSDEAATFTIRPWTYVCRLDDYTCRREKTRPANRSAIRSPDGTKEAFIRNYDLWMRDLATGEETQLTTDGEEDFGYATNNAGWVRRDRPVLLWSPDSRKIATFKHDGRGVGMMYLTTTNVGHPRLEAWKYPLPGDSLIFRIHRVVIDTEDGTMTRLDMPPDPHRSTICDHVQCRGDDWTDVEWSGDSRTLAFVSSSRDHKEAQLRVANPETGEVRDVLKETVDTFYESGNDAVNWRVLHGTDEVVWYSQRDNWGHLYLYDLATGELKRQLTDGDWNVLQVRRLDEKNRQIYFTGAGREPGDPYFEYFYRVGIDDGEVELLTPDSAHHEIALGPGSEYFVDTYSTPTTPPVSVLRDANGDVVTKLEAGDISELEAVGWQPPQPFVVKARDGETDLYGLMYTPTQLDPTEKYPVINYLYPGPQSGSVGTRSFRASRGDKQALAELGFVVVEVDAMGTPMRSKSFHEAYYGNMGDNGLPDQIAMIKQLGDRHPFMDLDRVGIYGHSGGGFASTAGILRYPDFYKVAVSGAGNHDNRNYEDDWAEKWQGLLEENDDGTTNYDNQANQLLAENLEGKLLLGHGTMDTNVPFYNTLLVVDALIAANKDFDLVLFPNEGHGGWGDYWTRRRWDYFVEHLLGAEPPKEYDFGTE